MGRDHVPLARVEYALCHPNSFSHWPRLPIFDARAADARDVREVGRELDRLGGQVSATRRVVTAVARGEIHRDPGERRLQGELLVEGHVARPEQVDVVDAVGPRVRDHVGDVVVDRAGPRIIEATQAVRGTDVDDLRAGAIACTASTSRVSSPYQPCGPHSSIVGVTVGTRGDLRELAPSELRLMVHLVVDLGVLVDRGRRVSVGDRHGHPAAVHARGEE